MNGHEKILEVLLHHDSLHTTEIVKEAGRHPVTIDRECYQLYQKGYIRATGNGVYQLTERGERFLDEKRNIS